MNRQRTISRKQRKHKSFLQKYPRRVMWAGGIGAVVLYVWIFYYLFVGPTGFRWRALYGDTDYPEGY